MSFDARARRDVGRLVGRIADRRAESECDHGAAAQRYTENAAAHVGFALTGLLSAHGWADPTEGRFHLDRWPGTTVR